MAQLVGLMLFVMTFIPEIRRRRNRVMFAERIALSIREHVPTRIQRSGN